MTKEREEAIKLLTQYIDYDAETPDYYEMEKACKVALKVLKQEPCEDCISRKAVLDCFKKWQPYMATRIFEYEQELKTLPSVQPKQKTGHWKKLNVGYGCSECSLATNKSGVDFYRFCPNCGAKMESEEV